MGRHRRRPLPTTSQEELWCGALEIPILNNDDVFVVQIIGISSPSQTAFARVIVVSSDGIVDINPQVTVGQVVCTVVREAASSFHLSENQQQNCFVTSNAGGSMNYRMGTSLPLAMELLRLGSVWILPQGERSRRAKGHDENCVVDWSRTSVRVHYNPSRFPAANTVEWSKYYSDSLPRTCRKDGHDFSPHGAIVHEDYELGFAILNKPGGLPAHATICNNVENVVSLWKNELMSRGNEENLYVTLPQRLDTETYGLLVVALKREFASYMSKLLEAKTKNQLVEDNRDCKTKEQFISAVATMRKQYRCLVCLQDQSQAGLLKQLSSSKSVLTHYLDPQRDAPRNFVANPPCGTESSSGFQKCQLIITNVESRVVNANAQSRDEFWKALAKRLWGGNAGNDNDSTIYPTAVSGVAQLEIELLTGRTHQIRGQLAALGYPIVGDALYGCRVCQSIYQNDNGRKTNNRMALQCCELSFPEPCLNTKGRFVPSKQRTCCFQLKRAWWTELLEKYLEAS